MADETVVHNVEVMDRWERSPQTIKNFKLFTKRPQWRRIFRQTVTHRWSSYSKRRLAKVDCRRVTVCEACIYRLTDVKFTFTYWDIRSKINEVQQFKSQGQLRWVSYPRDTKIIVAKQQITSFRLIFTDYSSRLTGMLYDTLIISSFMKYINF